MTAVRDAGGKGYTSRNRWLAASAQLSADGGKSWNGWIVVNKTGPRDDFRLQTAFDTD